MSDAWKDRILPWLSDRWNRLLSRENKDALALEIPPSPLRDLGFEAEGTPPFLGREDLLERCARILVQPGGGNPLLVGAAGSGKTALARELALRLRGLWAPVGLAGHRVLTLSVMDLGAGCGNWGGLEQRLREIAEWLATHGDILFIDEIHTIVNWGDNQGLHDIANHLKPLLSHPRIRVIGATTWREAIPLLRDCALARRFVPVPVPGLGTDTLIDAVGSRADQHDLVLYREESSRIVDLARRLIPHRPFPDSAFVLVDALIAHVHCHGVPGNGERLLLRLALEQAGVAGDCPVGLQGLARRHPRYARFLLRLARYLEGEEARPLRFWLPRREPAFMALLEDLAPRLGRPVRIDAAAAGLEGLLGAAPGLVGYHDYRPVHDLLLQPFSPLLIEGISSDLNGAGAMLRSALEEGVLTDRQGVRVPLVLAIVVGEEWGEPVCGSLERHDARVIPFSSGR